MQEELDYPNLPNRIEKTTIYLYHWGFRVFKADHLPRELIQRTHVGKIAGKTPAGVDVHGRERGDTESEDRVPQSTEILLGIWLLQWRDIKTRFGFRRRVN